MGVLEWVSDNLPGRLESLEDRLRIDHQTGEVSHLWYAEEPLGSPLDELDLEGFDGLDLFSSTFKLASRIEPRLISGVRILPTFDDLAHTAELVGADFPSDSIPFMHEPGCAIYAVGRDEFGVCIYKWDQDFCRLTGEYDSLLEILDEWLDAVR